MATTAPRRPVPLLRVPPIRDYGAPGWFERLPRGVGTGGVLLVLLAVSGFIRAHYLSGQFWSDEANTVGIASHPLSAIPGVLWRGGGAPLYFVLLHLWMQAFGSSEAAAHALSLLFGLLTIPVALALGWSVFGRRFGYIAAALFAFNSFLTQYAEEARPYELMALLGLIAAGSFLHAFHLRRRRGWLPLFWASLVLLVYTDAWGLFVWFAFAVALVPILRVSEDRRGILRDAALVFGLAACAYAPWIPTLVHQASQATAPWHYAPLLGANVPRQLLGTDRVDAAFALVVVAGLVPLLARDRRRTRQAIAVGGLIVFVVAALLAALVVSVAIPAWLVRYFAPIVPALLLVCALACTRSGILGLAIALLTCAFLANAASFIPSSKSDMRDVAGEIAPGLHPGDLVLLGAPEQAPLADYYFPGGLRYATLLGPDPHPTYMNWDDAQSRLAQERPAALVRALAGELRPGQRLVFVRPLTEGELHWAQDWSILVRRRAAQTGAALAADPQLERLPGVYAPHFYKPSCCVAASALVYVKAAGAGPLRSRARGARSARATARH